MIIKTNERTATWSLLIQQTLQIPSTLRDSPALIGGPGPFQQQERSSPFKRARAFRAQNGSVWSSLQ